MEPPELNPKDTIFGIHRAQVEQARKISNMVEDHYSSCQRGYDHEIHEEDWYDDEDDDVTVTSCGHGLLRPHSAQNSRTSRETHDSIQGFRTRSPRRYAIAQPESDDAQATVTGFPLCDTPTSNYKGKTQEVHSPLKGNEKQSHRKGKVRRTANTSSPTRMKKKGGLRELFRSNSSFWSTSEKEKDIEFYRTKHTPGGERSRRSKSARPSRSRVSETRPSDSRHLDRSRRAQSTHQEEDPGRRAHRHQGERYRQPKAAASIKSSAAYSCSSGSFAETKSPTSIASPGSIRSNVDLPPHFEKVSDQREYLKGIQKLFQVTADKIAPVQDRAVPVNSSPGEDYERRMKHVQSITQQFQEELEMLGNTYYATLQPVDDAD